VVKGAGTDFGSGFDISSPAGDELAPIPPQLKPTVRDYFNVERRRCTKEMHIALDMQKEQLELQIIGPDPRKFFRRREYGVGKYCDVAIDECSRP